MKRKVVKRQLDVLALADLMMCPMMKRQQQDQAVVTVTSVDGRNVTTATEKRKAKEDARDRLIHLLLIHLQMILVLEQMPVIAELEGAAAVDAETTTQVDVRKVRRNLLKAKHVENDLPHGIDTILVLRRTVVDKRKTSGERRKIGIGRKRNAKRNVDILREMMMVREKRREKHTNHLRKVVAALMTNQVFDVVLSRGKRLK